jgi:serine/threonine-protein phosphatase 2A regulatory subunit B
MTSSDETSVSQNGKKETLNILEWRFNQFLGEKMRSDEFYEEENQGYIISTMKMTDKSEHLIIGDKGGRIIIFKKDGNGHHNKLSYFFEYSAFEKDFDVHKSTEYSEIVRSVDILPYIYNDKIDILSCGYRTIKLHRVHNKKIKFFSNEKGGSGCLKVPKLKTTKDEVSSKLRRTITLTNSSELNNISVNRTVPNQFIACSDTKVSLFDLEHTNTAFELFDLENQNEEDTSSVSESITVSKVNKYNPNVFGLGTTFGNIKVCDFRTTSDYMKVNTSYLDEFNNILKSGFNLSKTLFSYQIMSVHDLEFVSEYMLATRHYLSLNIWDIRMDNSPMNKFLVYEPVIPRLSYLYKNNFLQNDKFQISVSNDGNYILTGDYNNMFHVFDVKQRLNTQCTLDESSERNSNTNIIRKINSKGSCYYKKDDPSYTNIDFESKIFKHCYSPSENWIILAQQNCLYSYSGSLFVKEQKAKAN